MTARTFEVSANPELRVAAWIKGNTRGCKSVIDLGCGRAQYTLIPGAEHSCGIDSFEPYIADCKERIPGATFICGDIRHLLAHIDHRHDVALLIDVVEHLNSADSVNLIRAVQTFADKILVFAPLGVHEQGEVDNNPAQRHISTWFPHDLQGLGFNVTADPYFHHTNPPEKQGAMFAVWEKAS